MEKMNTGISILICSYNMERELPRTVETLVPPYQKGMENCEIEIIILDNGSNEPPSQTRLEKIWPNIQVLSPAEKKTSPAAAINWAMAQSKHSILGFWIDGARMASPGILRNALQAWRINSHKVIGTLGFHLGSDVQMRSAAKGYNQKTEDALLKTVDWRKDGYVLFDISVLAGSSSNGWFHPISESNGVFMTKEIWEKLGGLNESFESPGGGYVNLDFWERAVVQSDHQPWMILGEGTFHQYHGGAATGGDSEARQKMAAEYAALKGRNFKRLDYSPCFVGTLTQKSAITLQSRSELLRRLLRQAPLVKWAYQVLRHPHH